MLSHGRLHGRVGVLYCSVVRGQDRMKDCICANVTKFVLPSRTWLPRRQPLSIAFLATLHMSTYCGSPKRALLTILTRRNNPTFFITLMVSRNFSIAADNRWAASGSFNQAGSYSYHDRLPNETRSSNLAHSAAILSKFYSVNSTGRRLSNSADKMSQCHYTIMHQTC